MKEVTRRDFVKDTAKISAGAAVGLGALRRSTASWAGANDRLRVAVLGLRRGRAHIRGYNDLENVEVAVLCDIDESRMREQSKELFEDQGLAKPQLEPDLRRVLEDDSIDIISIATPNHWHSLAGIWACQAGKDVYVEKPCSHNIFEGRKLVEAARQYDRIVQHGTQIRSNPAIQEAVKLMHEGAIGEVYMAKGLCYKRRDTIGHTPDAPVPEGVHYDLWIGPAPEKPFSQNRFHYNWHWQWDYGNGDIGNQGVHQLDVARWGLGVDLPSEVVATGNHFMFDDDQETPNSLLASFVYPHAGKKGKILNFEVRHWDTNDEAGVQIGNIFYGSEGYLTMDTYSRYTIHPKNGESKTVDIGGDHFANFIEAVRAHDRSILNAEIEEGHKSSVLGHLANIAYRTGSRLAFDPERERFLGGEADANALLSRVYRKPYVVPGGASSPDGRPAQST
jgi:predicted dehydrogenase